MHPHPKNQGSVTLVALCFVAVLGIGLAGYLAVSNQAMKLSNRSYATSVSGQLAEMGLERALQAFNANDWSGWTLDTTNHRASRTISFASNKYGNIGLTTSFKMRVDNYDAATQGSTWSSSANYRINDLAGYNGIWYRCVKNHSNQTPPNLAYWAEAPIPWAWNSNTDYTTSYDIVNNNGIWYRCSTTHTSTSTFDVTKWTVVPAPSLAWNGATAYTTGAFVYYSGTWYRCVSNNTGSTPPSANWSTTSPYISWAYRAAVTYSFNDVVYYNAVWYRYINGTATSGNLPTNTTYWENALTGTMFGWSNASINYNLGDVVYYGTTSKWYRCILAHTSSGALTPSNTTYWANTPLLTLDWNSGQQYSQNDTVRYKGVWYLSLQNGNVGQVPSAAASTYWIGANTANASYTWSSTATYAAGDYRCYGGVWYTCIGANIGASPNNTFHWTSTWANSNGITLGAPVIYAESTVALTNSPAVKTLLRALIAPAPLFPNAVAASTTINMSAAGTIDSYDATTGDYPSQAGTSTSFAAVVAAAQTSGTAITLSSTAVSGYLAAPASSSSPYAPLYSSGGSVKGFTSPASPNIDLSRISRSPYIPQFTPLPAGGLAAAFGSSNFSKGTLLPLSTATVNIGTPGATTPSRYYYSGDLIIGTGTTTTLNINGPVILYTSGDLFVTAGGTTGVININSAGSAEIHIANSLKVDQPSVGIYNQTLDPKKLIVICDTASSSSQFYSDGSNPVYGAIYIPNTTSATGFFNDNSNVQIYGAISANKITYSGANANVHYDTSLRYATFGGVDQPHAITEWRELPPTEQATMP